MPSSTILLSTFLIFSFTSLSKAHGFPSWPRPRGLLAANNFGLEQLKTDANADYCPHCLNGGGTGSVQQNTPDGKWTPYEPTDPSFRFRNDHGMCGDKKGENQHMAPDGTFYSGTTIATYEEEDFIDMETLINAHHNGFFDFFICSLDCCGEDDISEKCFKKNGCCRKLMRVPHKSCESGYDRICGPVDKNHPGRWYLPPRDQETPTENWYGGLNKKMRYALPKGMIGEKCVIHWSWTTANSCNPPGYVEYNFPEKWDGIPGDGGSIGSINKQFATCGSDGANFPEEFWTCSENIRIVPKNEGKDRTLQKFHNGEMNIEGPSDSNSDQLLPPMKEPTMPMNEPNMDTPDDENDENDEDDEEEYESKPPAKPTSTPAPAKPVVPKDDNAEGSHTGSKYDLTAFLSTFDTGVCLKAQGNVSYCQSCIDLGYGATKCMWCTVDGRGIESCLHKKPDEY